MTLNNRWRIVPSSPERDALAQSWGVSPLTAQLMINRGIKTVAAGEKFLRGTLQDLRDPWEMKDLAAAVERIIRSLENKERIVVYGDYDVDGQTSVALLVRVLRALTDQPQNIDFYVPHRLEEGYGMNCEAVAMLAERCELLITVDCGITSIAEVELARELGLDVIVTDHHQPGEILPPAIAVLNPKQTDCPFSFKELAGVGVAYKLVQGLGEKLNQDFSAHLDLVALGTIADLVPLQDENRILVKYGLELLGRTVKPGLQALLKVSGIEDTPRPSDIGFRLAPRLNAVGRLQDSSNGVRLLLTENFGEAINLAEQFNEENRIRQQMEKEMFKECVSLVEEHGWSADPAIVVAGDGWHPGVIGIVASRLVEKYYRPTVVIALEGGEGRGSARSIPTFNLYKGLASCSDLLTRFGGHAMAAGLSIEAAKVSDFRRALCHCVDNQLTVEDFVREIYADAELPPEQIDLGLVEELERLEPCGIGNPQPLLYIQGSVAHWDLVGQEKKHLKCQIRGQDYDVVDGIGFGLGPRMEELEGFCPSMEFLVVPQINNWRQQRNVQVVVKDLRPSLQPRNFVDYWLMEQYPWVLPWNFDLVGALRGSSHFPDGDQAEITGGPPARLLDQRGVNAKTRTLMSQWSAKDLVLIYVRNPRQALQVCRDLRIAYPGQAEHIAFEHEYLDEGERDELMAGIASGRFTWIVSSGMCNWSVTFSGLAFWDVPCGRSHELFLRRQIANDGTLLLLFGIEERRLMHVQVQMALPDRNLLAQFYRELIKNGSGALVSWAEVEKVSIRLRMRLGQDLAIQTFTDLKLLELSEDGITILPPPHKKLDLYSSLLYNEGMEKRRKILVYLQHCLERGFYNNGFEAENSRYS